MVFLLVYGYIDQLSIKEFRFETIRTYGLNIMQLHQLLNKMGNVCQYYPQKHIIEIRSQVKKTKNILIEVKKLKQQLQNSILTQNITENIETEKDFHQLKQQTCVNFQITKQQSSLNTDHKLNYITAKSIPLIKSLQNQLNQLKTFTQIQLEKTSFKYLEQKQEQNCIYKGQLKNGLKHGFGKAVYKNAIYEGMWKEGLYNGKGRYIQPNGCIYQGQFFQGNKNGFGIFVKNQKYKYQGQWKNNLPHGIGLQIWANGTKYQGQYFEGHKHGKGHLLKSNGSMYSGQFVNNKFQGYGDMRWSDGRSYIGYWKNNLMHGQGSFTWRDGKKYVGKYQNGKKHGKSQFINGQDVKILEFHMGRKKFEN